MLHLGKQFAPPTLRRSPFGFQIAIILSVPIALGASKSTNQQQRTEAKAKFVDIMKILWAK